MNLPALQSTVTDMVVEYEEKLEGLEARIVQFEQAQRALEMGAMVQGTFVAPAFDRAPMVSGENLRKNLLKSGWRAIYNRLQIERIASAKDKRIFDQALQDPPPLTFENARATFGDYFENMRFHLLRGLAEVFADLDPAYKSHSKVQIGVKALPKRIILRSFGGYGSYGRDKLRDVVNALAAFRGQPLMEHDEMSAIDAAHRKGDDAVLDGRTYEHEVYGGRIDRHTTRHRGLTVRKFQNGNAHVIFDKLALADINRALAEFYGEVLPDAEEEGVMRPGTDVAKNLAFYPTPQAVVEAMFERLENNLGFHGVESGRVLEPSCGDGAILDAIRERGHRGFGIEVHPGRAATARSKGHDVLTANFLECPPRPIYDWVVMNPPFAGRHYVKHVRHALKFLKPEGLLVAALPATAWYDHKELQGEWRDLPVASFASSGTNIPTGTLVMRAPS